MQEIQNETKSEHEILRNQINELEDNLEKEKKKIQSLQMELVTKNHEITYLKEEITKNNEFFNLTAKTKEDEIQKLKRQVLKYLIYNCKGLLVGNQNNKFCQSRRIRKQITNSYRTFNSKTKSVRNYFNRKSLFTTPIRKYYFSKTIFFVVVILKIFQIQNEKKLNEQHSIIIENNLKNKKMDDKGINIKINKNNLFRSKIKIYNLFG